MALRMTIGETLIRHGSDVLRWLDGSSAADLSPVSMASIDRPMELSFSTRPRDLQWLHKTGRTTLWRTPRQDLVAGEATENQRARPNFPLFRIAGQALDPSGVYNPRPFDLELGDGNGRGLVLYPSPQGTRFGNGGGLQGTLRRNGSLAQVAWALIEVEVTVSANDLRRFRAQADGKGDFRLSLWRLPPLPQGTGSYQARLSVRGDFAARAQDPVDPAGLGTLWLGPVGAGPFAADIGLALVPGEVQRVASRASDRGYLLLRSPPPPPPDS